MISPVKGAEGQNATCRSMYKHRRKVLGKLAAIGALVRYSNNQAYFVLQHLDPPLGQKAVTVVTPDENAPLNLKVEKVFVS